MSTKTINSRIMNKMATQAEWRKSADRDFIPLKGEMIVYDIDENYEKRRLKVGNGSTPASVLPFVGGIVQQIEEEPIPYPYQSNTLTYNGSSQSVVWANYDASKMTLSGNNTVSATDAGEYQVTFTPKTGYCWENSSTDPYVTTWTIHKMDVVFTASKTTLNLTIGQSGSVIVTYYPIDAYGGRPSVSYDTSVITLVDEKLSIQNGSVITTYSVSMSAEALSGTYPIKFYLSEKTNYKYGEIIVNIEYEGIKSLNDYTWQEIADIAAKGLAEDYFDIGDLKSVGWEPGDKTINIFYNQPLTTSFNPAEVPYVYIVDFDHDESQGIQFGTFKTLSADVAIYASHISDAVTAGGWRDSYLRYNVLGSCRERSSQEASSAINPFEGTLLATFPEDLRAVMRPMTVYTNNTGSLEYYPSSASVTPTQDMLPLLSEIEVFGSASNAINSSIGQQSQYAYYAIGNPKIKTRSYDSSNAHSWWLRDPAYSANNSWCSVSDTGSRSINYPTTMNMISPVFTVCGTSQFFAKTYNKYIVDLLADIANGTCDPTKDCDLLISSASGNLPVDHEGYRSAYIFSGAIVGQYVEHTLNYAKYVYDTVSEKWYYAAEYSYNNNINMSYIYCFEIDAR